MHEESWNDSIKYPGRMVDKHGIRPDPDTAEAVLTEKLPKTEHQLINFWVLPVFTGSSSRAMRIKYIQSNNS